MGIGFSVVIVEAHQIIRAGIRLLVERIRGACVIGEATEGREALAMIGKLRPDVVVTDISIPILDGIALTREIQQRYSHVTVVILSELSDEANLSGALSAGASAYVLTSSAVDELEFSLLFEPR
jgi:DNA-binding NarL/FixJ family response regulator